MLSKDYLKSIIFGLEDSLVSTTGLVVGVAAGSNNINSVILASLVAICVEAFSMASGEFVSQTSGSTARKIKLSLCMLFSYFIGGLVPIIPVLLQVPNYLFFSVIFSIVGLFFLGWGKASVLGQNKGKSALQVLVIGGVSMAIGLLAGKFFQLR